MTVKLLLKYKWYIAVILVLLVVEPTLNSVLNFWLQQIYNSAAPNAEKLYILRLLTTGFLLWIAKRVVTFSLSVIQNRYICSAKQDVKHALFVRLLGLDTSSIASSGASGEYISVFTNDITLLEQRFFSQIIGLISSAASLVILGTSFVVLNRTLALSIFAFGALAMFVPLLFSKRLNSQSLKYSKSISKFTQRLKEYLVAYPTIKNYAVEREILMKFDSENASAENAKFEADYTVSLAGNVGMLLSWFMQFICVGIGVMLVIRGDILIGTVVAAQGFAGDLAMPLQNIILNINSIHSVKEIVKKIDALTADYRKPDAPAKPRALPDNERFDIDFDSLSLELGGNKIIDGFSFRFEERKKYLLVGVNGSGKSSVFKALKKWYKICGGSIKIGGAAIDTLTSEQIGGIVSYLNENVSLFSGSVRENIELFRDYSNDALKRAVSCAHVELELEREIADEGHNISSGEQRRIEVARSLLGSVKILIFDEVVSTLDIETAYEIERLALSFKEQTVIFISHNFSGKLIREYDEILVMDKGRLISHGTYDTLIKSCPYFRRICEIKFGNI